MAITSRRSTPHCQLGRYKMRSLALSALALAFTAPLIHAQEGATTGDPNIPVLCEEGCFNVLMAFGYV